MKILYIANIRMPTPRAHGLQIVKTCEAFADNGADVLMLVPKIKNSGEDPYDFYGVKRNFEIKRLFALDWLFLDFAGYIFRELTFSLAVLFFGRREWKNTDIIFARSIFPAYTLSFFRRGVFFEMHDWPQRFHQIWKMMLSRMTGIVSTNHWKADKLKAEFLIPADKILVYPNGFDPKLFNIKESKEELRKLLNLPREKPIAMYTGHFYDWKGADVMAEAARLLSDVNFVFVGGTKEDMATFREKVNDLKNIFLLGHKPYPEIPKYLKAADVLVLPNSAKTEESQYATSPIKLFEYMASGVPIVASRLPSIEEVVSDKEVFFVDPDEPELLAQKIKLAVSDIKSKDMAVSSQKKSLMFSWYERARVILEWAVEI